tara:strand:- start:1160 stop:1450 length:291 start_codon:yes stop_codon:yes gene_type:complete
MMKFFAAFFIMSAILIGANGSVTPIRPEVQVLVPSKIVDTKKIGPIKVPHTSCIVSVEEEHTLEEHLNVCLAQRKWLNIDSDTKEQTILRNWRYRF